MSKIPFDHWLNKKLANHNSSVNYDEEWEAILPHLNDGKKKKKFFIWIFLTLGIIIGGSMAWVFNDKIEMFQSDDQIAYTENLNSQLTNEVLKQKSTVLKNKQIFEKGSHDSDSDINVVNSNEIFHVESKVQKLINEHIEVENKQSNYKKGNRIHRDANRPSNDIIKENTKTNNSILIVNRLDVRSSEIKYITKKEFIDILDYDVYNTNISTANHSDFNQYLSLYSSIGMYSSNYHTENLLAKQYIAERSKTISLLESIQLDLGYNHRIGNTNWYLGIGLNYTQDNYWFVQEFKDTMSVLYRNWDLEIIKYADQSIEVTKNGDAYGKQTISLRRKILGKRISLGIPVAIKYHYKLNQKNILEASVGGVVGIKSYYSGYQIKNSSHDIDLISYEKGIKSTNGLYYYNVGLNYLHRLNNTFDIVAGIKFSQEIKGDEGVYYDWSENRKYYYFSLGVNASLN